MLKRKVLDNGFIKLTGTDGVYSIKADAVYSVVECKPTDEKFYVDYVKPVVKLESKEKEEETKTEEVATKRTTRRKKSTT